MLLMPLGLEDRLVGRPWTVLFLLVLNVVAFAGLALNTDRSAVTATQAQLVAFLVEHPHLEPPPDLAARLGDEVRTDLRVARSVALGRGPLPDQASIEADLAHLAEHTNRLLRAERSLPLHRFGFKPAAPTVRDLFLSMFLHAGFAHLFFNMVFLWVSGPFLEALFGPRLFLVLYLVSGVIATGAHWATYPGSLVPLVGASGAIAGLMGAFSVRLGTSRIRFLLAPSPVTLYLPAIVVFPLWLGEQLFEARFAGAGGGVAFLAHVGGFISGVLFALAVGALGLEDRRRKGATAIDVSPLLTRARRARERRSWPEAHAELDRALAAAPSQREVLEEAVELALAERDEARLGTHGGRLLDLVAREGPVTLQDWLAALRGRSEAPLPAALLLSAASQLARLDAADAALSLLEEIADDAPATWAFRGLIRGAELLDRVGRRAEARQWYQRARRHPSCTGAWPATVDAALARLAATSGG